MTTIDLRAIRDRLAAQHPAGIHGHARPPGAIGAFPCYVVRDPSTIAYRTTMGGRPRITLPIRVIVERLAEQDNTAKLDDLVSELPAQLEAIDPDGLWQPRGLNIIELAGGYSDYQQGTQLVGIAADLTATIDI